MLSAVIAVDGPLGDAVALTLERATPPWQARRAGALAGAASVLTDVVIVDDDVDDRTRRTLTQRYGAPLLVLGRDVDKPFSASALRAKALSYARPSMPDDGLVAVDRPLRHALRVLEVAAPRRAGVLITGPTGVGKERLARRVHDLSGRRGPFVPLNCAALHDGLAESALFGHARGAFTGALSRLPGAIVEADGGTLFLDEVGELDLRIQAKLLRVLEDHRVRALGASGDRPVDLRVVAATNRDLGLSMARGEFRSDLYYRLATFVVRVPSLAERPRDLAGLLDLLVARHDRAGQVTLGNASREALLSYSWPGNVRELGNVVERVIALAPPGELGVERLRELAPELALDPRGTDCVARARRGEVRKGAAAAELGVHRTTLWRRMKREKEK
jgi:transcriptional regulator with PAS, ATPase and Fis domain